MNPDQQAAIERLQKYILANVAVPALAQTVVRDYQTEAAMKYLDLFQSNVAAIIGSSSGDIKDVVITRMALIITHATIMALDVGEEKDEPTQ